MINLPTNPIFSDSYRKQTNFFLAKAFVLSPLLWNKGENLHRGDILIAA